MPLEPNAVAFYLLAAMTLASGLAVVGSPNLFHAGIALISCFLGVAGLYITLHAPFLGAMQVLIYAGAIAVVLLFAFMLTHALMSSRSGRFQNAAGIGASVLVGAMLIRVGLDQNWAPANPNPETDVQSLAHSYMTNMVVPFELSALLLLVALVGAVVIARKEEGPPEP